MSNYIVITDYEAKDNLLTGNPAKLIKGAEFTAEFNAIATAITTKADSLSPTLTTPNLGVATATSINKVTITAPATGSTLTVADGKTLTASNSLTLAGTDGTTLTFQGTDTYVGRTTTDTLTNKTLTAPVINGTVTTTGLTLPALTLGGTVTSNGQSFSGTIANLGTVTTVDINGGTLDGVTIGGSSAAAATVTSLTASGNLTFTGTGNTISGDFSNATLGNRVRFRTSTTDSPTSLGVVPNGTSGSSDFTAYNLSSGLGNSVYVSMKMVTGTEARLETGKYGSGIYVPMTFYTGGSERVRIDTSGNVTPGADNTQNFGSGALRWATIYAGTGTINTSDEREKQDIADLDEAEKRVAIALKSKVKKFRFKDAVERKGDDARIHVGVIAQEVMAAFQAEGLDATKYGIICYDEWEDKFVEYPAIEAVEAKEAVLDEEGNVIEPAVEAVEGEDAWTEQIQHAGNRYGVRYEELLSFIIAAL